jgi:NADPH:quinone reductase-like Zn-dependent oxidoreductase
MKAAVYSANGGPDVISYVDVPDPVPANNEVLVRNEAIRIEGGDLLSRKRLLRSRRRRRHTNTPKPAVARLAAW